MRYYFDTEVGYENDIKFSRSLDPRHYKIITIQYQPLDDSGCPLSNLRILKEWESSEEKIIKEFANFITPKKTWDFIPVGYNVIFDLGFFKARAEKYGMDYDEWMIYHRVPIIDLKHICIGMNGFNFLDSGLDKFCNKPRDGFLVPEWYLNKEYAKIIDYIRGENEAFICFYQKLREKLPRFRVENKFYNY